MRFEVDYSDWPGVVQGDGRWCLGSLGEFGGWWITSRRKTTWTGRCAFRLTIPTCTASLRVRVVTKEFTFYFVDCPLCNWVLVSILGITNFLSDLTYACCCWIPLSQGKGNYKKIGAGPTRGHIWITRTMRASQRVWWRSSSSRIVAVS